MYVNRLKTFVVRTYFYCQVCSFLTVTRLIALIALLFLPVAGILIFIVIIYQRRLKTKKGVVRYQSSIIIPFGWYT